MTNQNGHFYLSNKKFIKREYKIEISLVTVYSSLVPVITEEIEAACERLNLPFKCTNRVLKKSELAGFQPNKSSDLTIILYRNEGRLLLTGENGLYDRIIRGELSQKSNHLSSRWLLAHSTLR